jgi:hypothetical protein
MIYCRDEPNDLRQAPFWQSDDLIKKAADVQVRITLLCVGSEMMMSFIGQLGRQQEADAQAV